VFVSFKQGDVPLHNSPEAPIREWPGTGVGQEKGLYLEIWLVGELTKEWRLILDWMANDVRYAVL